jgi:starch phosphorylase
VAYFSTEISFEPNLPPYSGGLRVLAGDTLRSAADIGIPMVGVTLVSRAGYFEQMIDAYGKQIELAKLWTPQQYAAGVCAKVAVKIEGRYVWIGAWVYRIKGSGGEDVPVLLLDTDLPENTPEDRELTHYLYGRDATYRLKQEMVLGVGGLRMLKALGFDVTKHHMNEGHSALLTMELLNQHRYRSADLRPGESPYDLPMVRSKCIFTTHTPVEAGQDKFDYAIVEKVAKDELVSIEQLKKLAGDDCLNMTQLALSLSDYVNGVAKVHAEVSQRMFPSYKVHAITNGVHPQTWTNDHFKHLYDQHFLGWQHQPEQLVRIDQVPQDALWQAHMQSKQQLFDLIYAQTGVQLDIDLPTIGFARRMTAYKRADLIFSDIEKLKAIAKKQPFQLVFAGKAHPSDQKGKEIIAEIHAHITALASDIKMVYLSGYDMRMGLALVSGVDVWLNTPLRPLEASGTSGMKASFNGVPSFSILDGWWLEGYIEGVTGWAIGHHENNGSEDDAKDLYEKLEHIVLPLYDNKEAWQNVMKGAIGRNASFFNTHRMIRRYATEAYML